MTINHKISRTHSIGYTCLLCVVTSTVDAIAQIPVDQWPSMPVVVTAHPDNEEEVSLIPGPTLPPEGKTRGSDPLISAAVPPWTYKGTLVYLARAWEGKGTASYPVLVLRSFGGPRLLPLQHIGPPGNNLRSDTATYIFHEGEFGSGDPQLSPDGHVLLYESVGFMPRYGSGALFEWDMVVGQVRQLTPRNIAYQGFFWAPDSQSVAYVSGGEETRKPAQLCIVSRRTHQTQTVALPPGVSLLLTSPIRQQQPAIVPIAWGPQTNLLLTGLPTAGADKSSPVYPNIYEVTAGKSTAGKATPIKAHLVVPDAYAPVPSPDGRWVACFGWPAAQSDELKAQPPQAGPNLYLFDRQEHRRLFVRALPRFGRREAQGGGLPPMQVLRWTPDSRRLIISEETYATQGKAGAATATISALDVPAQPLRDDNQWAQTLRPITSLHLSDFVAYPAIHFGPLQVSADGDHLFMTTLQTTGEKGEQTLSESSLQRIDLTNGQADVLARFNNDRLRGFDWHEEQK